MSASISKVDIKTEGDVLGFSTIMDYGSNTGWGMVARYGEGSTTENPVICVTTNYGGEKASL
jgi:hypothetical protein